MQLLFAMNPEDELPPPPNLTPAAVIMAALVGITVWIILSIVTGCTVVRPCPEETQRRAAEYEEIIRALSQQ